MPLPYLYFVEHPETAWAYTPGTNLRDILDILGHPVRTACLGHGACGLCRVRVHGNNLAAPTAAERLHIQATELAAGIRLACQITPQDDLHVDILNPALPSRWRTMPLPPPTVQRRSQLVRGIHPLAVAIDLGTSNIRVALLDVQRGIWLGQCKGANPQSSSGADVISRLSVAAISPSHAHTLAQQALNAIAEALHTLAARLGIELKRVLQVALVGNSTMLALLSGCDSSGLLNPDNWAQHLSWPDPDWTVWRDRWGISPHATLTIVPGLAGFVGSDLLAAIQAVDLTQNTAPALLVDFGTNSEIALWDGAQLWVTSAAGGPAFEVSGYQCGIPAESGAICRVQWQEDDTLSYTVLDNVPPRGLCGSGLIDLIACLSTHGILHKNGRFRDGMRSFSLPEGISLSMTDVDNFQQAKAAIAAGIEILCHASGQTVTNLARICVAGEFGRYLEVNSAMQIGLLPPVSPTCVTLYPEAALLGCADFIFRAEVECKIAQLRRQAHFINLATTEAFAYSFGRHLYLHSFPVLASR
jgi:uncharacterized 2Fe-2S/4Fe-4S cluster protein (DUF4445 family)